jgi:sensor histidine kinase YesM
MISIPAYYYQTIWFKFIILLVVSLTLILIILLKYQQIRMTNLKRQETLRMQSLQSQLNPHFIFNSLNSISYLISEKPAEIADQYVADFASLMRGFLDHSSRDFVSLRAEIDMIERYLALEHMRMKEKFDYEITCSDDIDPEALEVVPSMIQPFIENAVWHGVGMLKNRKGNIRVSFLPFQNDCIHCVIEDDGIGRKQSALKQSNDYRRRQSKGVSLVVQRVDILNSIYRTSYMVETEDLFPNREETGTRVRIPVKVRK